MIHLGYHAWSLTLIYQKYLNWFTNQEKFFFILLFTQLFWNLMMEFNSVQVSVVCFNYGSQTFIAVNNPLGIRSLTNLKFVGNLDVKVERSGSLSIVCGKYALGNNLVGSGHWKSLCARADTVKSVLEHLVSGTQILFKARFYSVLPVWEFEARLVISDRFRFITKTRKQTHPAKLPADC